LLSVYTTFDALKVAFTLPIIFAIFALFALKKALLYLTYIKKPGIEPGYNLGKEDKLRDVTTDQFA